MSLQDIFLGINWMAVLSALLTFGVGYLIRNAAYAKAKDTLKDIEELVHNFNQAQEDDKWTAEEMAKVIGTIKHIASDYGIKK